jgi:hypothetical protein
VGEGKANNEPRMAKVERLITNSDSQKTKHNNIIRNDQKNISDRGRAHGCMDG